MLSALQFDRKQMTADARRVDLHREVVRAKNNDLQGPRFKIDFWIRLTNAEIIIGCRDKNQA
jgi:hypothetical protein